MLCRIVAHVFNDAVAQGQIALSQCILQFKAVEVFAVPNVLLDDLGGNFGSNAKGMR